MRTLGEAVDFALCDQGLNPAELTAILSNSLEMRQFVRGVPRVVCGMSGDELAREIVARAGLKPAECRASYPFERSPQYTLDCTIKDLIWQPVALEYDSQSISSVKP